jgi:hypothetical protein
MNTNKTIIIVFLVLVSFSALGYTAETRIIEHPRQLVDPNTTGKLQLIIGVGATPKYLEEWVSTPTSTPARVDRIKEIKPEQTAYIGFFVTGYSLDKNKNVNCAVDVTIYNPKGQVLFSLPQYAKINGSNEENGFLALDPALDFTLEASDPEGTYKIEGIITDNISGKTAALTYELKLNKK